MTIHREQSPAYNYGYGMNGMNVEIRDVYDNSHPPVVASINIGPAATTEYEGAQRVQKALASPQYEGRMGFHRVEPIKDADDGTLHIYHTAWGGSIDPLIGQKELTGIADRHPNQTIIAIDSPGTGLSSALPQAVSREIARGTYIPQGEHEAASLKELFTDFEQVLFSGGSEGARRAIGAAAAFASRLNIPIIELHMLDPVGDHEQTPLELMRALAVAERAHVEEYIEASRDEETVAAWRESLAPLNVVKGIGKVTIRRGFLNQYIREIRGMAKDGLEADLRQALPYVRDIVTVSSPEYSELTDPNVTLGLLRRIDEQAEPSSRPTQFEQRVLQGQTHMLAAANPGSVGALLSANLPIL